MELVGECRPSSQFEDRDFATYIAVRQPVLRIRKILASWIQGAKNQPKTSKKKNLLSKPKSELLKKERL